MAATTVMSEKFEKFGMSRYFTPSIAPGRVTE